MKALSAAAGRVSSIQAFLKFTGRTQSEIYSELTSRCIPWAGTRLSFRVSLTFYISRMRRCLNIRLVD